MQKIRVLVVDDSAVMRRMLREAFSTDPGFEVVGVAANGRIAVQLLGQLQPDVVTLDIEMPEMDGLETVSYIRSRYPRLPVIMFSTLTVHGAAMTVEALSRGATDYVAKPADVGSYSIAIDRIVHELLPKARAACSKRRSTSADREVLRRSGHIGTISSQAQTRIDVVVVGTSTGGPNALAAVLPHIPENFPVPLLIVQHMPPVFTRFLADRLTVSCKLQVREGVAGQDVVAGQAWIAPGDYHMTVARTGTRVKLGLEQSAAENSCRPSVDVLFRSVAEAYGAGVLAVVMTGMGQDGLRGCEAVRQAGGRVFVQDEETSVVWGMPGFVAKAGLANKVLPLEQIGSELVRAVAERSRFSLRAAAQ